MIDLIGKQLRILKNQVPAQQQDLGGVEGVARLDEFYRGAG